MERQAVFVSTRRHISTHKPLTECALYSPLRLCFCMLRRCQINTVSLVQLYSPEAQKLLYDIASETCTVQKSLAIRTGPAGHRIYQWFGSSSVPLAHAIHHAGLREMFCTTVVPVSKGYFRGGQPVHIFT